MQRPTIEASRILVVRLGAIGDALRVLPAVRRLRIERPQAVIGWAVESWVAPLLEANPNVDRFHVLDRGSLRKGGVAVLVEMSRFAKEVRAFGYDTVLDFHGRLKSGVVALCSGAERRIGYAPGCATEGNHLFSNVHVQLADPLENRVSRFLHLLGPLGIEAGFDPAETGIHVRSEVTRDAVDWYRKLGQPPLAVYPGTSGNQAAYHRWPVERWAALLGRLAADGVRHVVFWGPDDAEYAREVAARAGVDGVVAPATTLPQMMAMLSCFSAFVGTNSAAMHMAWLQGVPTAMFSGPALRRTDAPLGPVPSRVFRADGAFRSGVSKRHQPDVVRAVPVEEVYAAVRELLQLDAGAGVATVGREPA